MNLYAIIVSLVLGVGLFGTGARIGYKYAAGEQASASLVTATATAEAARIAAKTEFDEALALAQKQASSRAKARDAQHQLEVELAKDEAAHKCRISAGTLGVLQQSISAANGQGTALGVDGAVPLPGPAQGRNSTGVGSVGAKNFGSLR